MIKNSLKRGVLFTVLLIVALLSTSCVFNHVNAWLGILLVLLMFYFGYEIVMAVYNHRKDDVDEQKN